MPWLSTCLYVLFHFEEWLQESLHPASCRTQIELVRGLNNEEYYGSPQGQNEGFMFVNGFYFHFELPKKDSYSNSFPV